MAFGVSSILLFLLVGNYTKDLKSPKTFAGMLNKLKIVFHVYGLQAFIGKLWQKLLCNHENDDNGYDGTGVLFLAANNNSIPHYDRAKHFMA